MDVHGKYDGRDARERRKQGLGHALERFAAIEERFRGAYGMRLPKHFAYAGAFFLGMSQKEARLAPVSLSGIGAWFHILAPGEAKVIAKLDERLHFRFRRDVPEFVTIASGDTMPYPSLTNLGKPSGSARHG